MNNFFVPRLSVLAAGCLLVSAAHGIKSFAEESLQSNVNCEAPQLSRQQISTIIQRERFVRDDLPAAPPASDVVVRRQRCHYIYMENPKGSAVHEEVIITLDQFGVIVDATVGRGNPDKGLACPKRRLSDEEVAELVKSERKKFKDLPVQPQRFSTRVLPKRCMYLYSELVSAKSAGKKTSLNFTVDQYGAVYSVYKQ